MDVTKCVLKPLTAFLGKPQWASDEEARKMNLRAFEGALSRHTEVQLTEATQRFIENWKYQRWPKPAEFKVFIHKPVQDVNPLNPIPNIVLSDDDKKRQNLAERLLSQYGEGVADKARDMLYDWWDANKAGTKYRCFGCEFTYKEAHRHWAGNLNNPKTVLTIAMFHIGIEKVERCLTSTH